MTIYFAARLQCKHCGTVSPEDASTRMDTDLTDDPGIHFLHVGDVVPYFRTEIRDSFVALRPLPDHGPIVILQDWYCAGCQSQRFAHVVFDQEGRLLRIDPVCLTRAALDAAHFAGRRFTLFYDELAGVPLYVDGKMRSDFVERLREKLPDNEPHRPS